MVTEFDKEIKAKLRPGIWQEEPDYQHWVDNETGLDCLIVRNNLGNLCGYVGIPKDHPLYGINYSDCSLPKARVPDKKETDEYIDEQMKFHIEQFKYTPERATESVLAFLHYFTLKKTCNDKWCNHTPESMFTVHGGLTYSNECHGKICHKTDNGDHVWWFGFDCAHLGDMSPGDNMLRDGTYRDINYVTYECESLAKQLKEYDGRRIENQ